MSPQFAPTPTTRGAVSHKALRRLLREEDAWLLRQIGSERPVIGATYRIRPDETYGYVFESVEASQ